MPWLGNDDPPERLLAEQNRLISLWPQPNTARVDARFRMIRSNPYCWPRAVQHFVRIKPLKGTPNTIYNGYLHVVVDTPDRFFGTTGLGPDGYEIELEIIQHDALVHPVYGTHGVEFIFTYKHTGFPDFFAAWYYASDGPLAVMNFLPAQFQAFTPSGGWLQFRTSWDEFVNTDWTEDIMRGGWEWWTLSECWEIEPPAPAGGDADLNGVDSDIIFDARTDWNGARYYLEFDIRNREDIGIVVLGKTFNTTQYFGFTGEYAFWNGYLTWMGEILTLDTWIHIRFEWAWTAEDSTYRVFWDGAPKGTKVGALRFNQFDTIGKKGPAFVGNYQLKNLFYATGEPGSEITLLDMPLIVDACDAGPDLIKGTTTNMVLPSCP